MWVDLWEAYLELVEVWTITCIAKMFLMQRSVSWRLERASLGVRCVYNYRGDLH